MMLRRANLGCREQTNWCALNVMTKAALCCAVWLLLGVPVFAQQGRGHVNGLCGPANTVATTTMPTSRLCSAGTVSTVSGTGPWSWTCIGSGGGSTAQCSAPLAQNPPVNGRCGPANGVATNSAPTAGLCSSGSPTTISGSGPWSWSCLGSNGGSTASCSAPTSGGASILPADRATTWNPGLTAVGGIPTRTTVCATLAPRGAGLDDTPQIQGAINACRDACGKDPGSIDHHTLVHWDCAKIW